MDLQERNDTPEPLVAGDEAETRAELGLDDLIDAELEAMQREEEERLEARKRAEEERWRTAVHRLHCHIKDELGDELTAALGLRFEPDNYDARALCQYRGMTVKISREEYNFNERWTIKALGYGAMCGGNNELRRKLLMMFASMRLTPVSEDLPLDE